MKAKEKKLNNQAYLTFISLSPVRQTTVPPRQPPHHIR
jgi:hypothetical protein